MKSLYKCYEIPKTNPKHELLYNSKNHSFLESYLFH